MAKAKVEEKKEETKLRSKAPKAEATAPVEPVVPETPAEPTPAPEPAKEAEMVDLLSADNRDLEVSIGDKFWKGKVISVPKEQEGDIRRILSEGGFFLKN